MMRKNVYVALVGQWSLAVLGFASSLIIARLLTPHELGVFTVSLAIISVLQTIQATGAREFLLYAKTAEIAERQSALALGVISSGGLALVLFIAAPFLADAYKTPGIEFVMHVVAFNTMLAVLAMPISAMVAREEHFTTSSTINVVSSLIQVVTQVALVWLGWSYRGLALALTASTLVNVAMHWAMRPHYITLRPRLGGIRHLAGFGSKLFLINVLNQINNASPQVIIGYLGGMGMAANYGRANNINQIYSTTIARAVDPVVAARIAAQTREGGSSIASMLASSRALLAISATFFGIVAVYAHILVPLMFGPQWADAIAPTRILSLGFAVWPLNSPMTALLMSTGSTGTLLRIRLSNAVLRVTLIIVLAPLGLTAIAWGVLAAIYLNTLQSAIATRSIAGLSLRQFADGLASSLFVAICAVAAAYGGPLLLPAGSHTLTVLLTGLACAFVAWSISLRLTDHILWTEFQITLRTIGRYTRAALVRTRPQTGD